MPPPPTTPVIEPAGASGDPHIRANPTVVGGRLGLGPSESPTDRVVALTGQLELLATQNRELQSRIKELEAQATNREQALKEALREVDTANDEVRRATALIQSLRAEIATLQRQVQQMEQEEIETLRRIITALERYLNPPLTRREP